MLLAAGNPLAGGTVSQMADKTKHIRVVRAFYWQKEVAKVGDVLEVPANAANEFVFTNKAVFCDPPSVAPAPVDEPPKPRAARKD